MTSQSREEAIKINNWELASQGGPVTDNSLVKDFIAGSDAAFTQLVGRYKDAITNYINTMVGDYDIAVDLSQETFLRVYQNIHRYSNLYQFSTWIYRIATNLAIDELRYRKRRGQVFYRNVWRGRRGDDPDGVEFELLDTRRSPRDEVLRKESGRILEEAIRSLPEKYRTAFVMKEIQELPYEEIAKILKCSPGTIKSRLHRARELLQRKLEHYV
ncbi:MAG: sigma-70 family RNA polymerase sigma factor [Acidobacteriota bacterium]|nr:sigma-70 family RNA polymerase sigma factor [Acidobacteriota bacterium]NLT32519.1 sigma-70 family RNA polymerase sigma factor [Acidobacteriota bacterium]